MAWSPVTAASMASRSTSARAAVSVMEAPPRPCRSDAEGPRLGGGEGRRRRWRWRRLGGRIGRGGLLVVGVLLGPALAGAVGDAGRGRPGGQPQQRSPRSEEQAHCTLL